MLLKLLSLVQSTPMNTIPIIALLTDFGQSDAYVGTMKGVILSICPAARLVDLTHTISPQNVRQAAYVLLTAYRYFPAHTVFLVVVDPGVGTDRAPVAVQTSQGLYVAPDNGVLSYVLRHLTPYQAVTLHNPAYHLPEVSRTFHGRDIFSPAAAHLANGVPISELGPAAPILHQLPDPVLQIASGQARGEILHIDHFGNLISSIGHLAWTDSGRLVLDPQFGSDHPALPPLDPQICRISLGGQTIHAIHRTYGAVPPDTLTALVGSSGQLEIGVNQGSAAHMLDLSPGDPIMLDFGARQE